MAVLITGILCREYNNQHFFYIHGLVVDNSIDVINRFDFLRHNYFYMDKKMYRFLILLSLTMVFGCKNLTVKTIQTDSDTTATHSKPIDDIIANVEGCYMLVLQRDTFAAILQQQGNDLTGRMSFDNYEKDGSTGTVKGSLQGDKLKLVYSFASEGKNSVMELYFKYKDDTIIRGIGEMNTKGDSAYFMNPALIKYEGSVLKKIPCETLPDKYK